MYATLNALKYLNRLSMVEMATVLFPNRTETEEDTQFFIKTYFEQKWNMWMNDRLEFLWALDDQRIMALETWINDTMG